MSPAIQVVLSGCLTFGVPLAVAVHELIALRRRPRGGWQPSRPVAPPPAPIPPGTTPTMRPLPACLVPVISPNRQIAVAESRQRELAETRT